MDTCSATITSTECFCCRQLLCIGQLRRLFSGLKSSELGNGAFQLQSGLNTVSRGRTKADCRTIWTRQSSKIKKVGTSLVILDGKIILI